MKTTFLIGGLTLVLAAAAFGQPNFERVTNTALTALSLSGGGAAWADYDLDGWPDLVQGNFDGPNLLFHNNGDGTFTLITTNGVHIPGPESYAVSWGDIDNDGWPDLFIGDGYNSGAASLLFHNLTPTNGTFQRVLSGPGTPSLMAHSSGCAWADYDRDGFLDLFVANWGEPSFLWHNKGNGTFERVLTGTIATHVADCTGAAWADYDNDGWPDLFIANGFADWQPAQKNLLYHNNGDGTFTQITNGPVVNDVGKFCGVAWGDYDNDGFLDLFVTGIGGHNYLYHNDGGTNFTRITQGDIVLDTGDFISAGWADYDNDGWLDLFVGNRAPGGKILLYHNNGDGTFTKVTTGPIAEDSAPNGGCAWGDFDNSGNLGLFVSVLGGKSLLYRNTGTTNNWLKVYLHPTKSNGSAIGARVRVTADIQGKTVTQVREISTGDGFNGNSQVAQFGLGDSTRLSSVSVQWPSGALTTIPFRLFSGALNIWEPTPPSLSHLRLLRGTNSQIDAVEVQLNGDPTRLSVYDSLKVLQDVWHGYVMEASTNLVHWEPCSVAWDHVPPGTTFYDEGFWPGTIPLLPPSGGSGTNMPNQLFFRARDLGFVGRVVPWICTSGGL